MAGTIELLVNLQDFIPTLNIFHAINYLIHAHIIYIWTLLWPVTLDHTSHQLL